MKRSTAYLGLIAATALASAAAVLSADEILRDVEAGKYLSLENVTETDGVVSGTVVNNSAGTAENVELSIQYSWIWENEFRPGEDNPSRTVFYTLPGAIPAGGSQEFTFNPDQPMPLRDDGHFVTSVAVSELALQE